MEPNPKEIAEILEAVSTKVPELITKLLRTLYSEEAGREMGKAVGSLYKELTESGIPQDVALNMTRDYMFSLKDLTRNMSPFPYNRTPDE